MLIKPYCFNESKFKRTFKFPPISTTSFLTMDFYALKSVILMYYIGSRCIADYVSTLMNQKDWIKRMNQTKRLFSQCSTSVCYTHHIGYQSEHRIASTMFSRFETTSKTIPKDPSTIFFRAKRGNTTILWISRHVIVKANCNERNK